MNAFDSEQLASQLFDTAKAEGADAADIMISHGESLSVTHRKGKQEALERSEGVEIGIRAFIGRKQALVSGNDLDPAVLKDLTLRAIAMARAAPEDPYCGIEREPVPIAKLTLDLDDGRRVSAEDLNETAIKLDDLTRAAEGITNSEGASAQHGRSTVFYATSAGFSASRSGSHNGLSVSLIAGQGDHMQSDYAWHQARHGSDLKTPEELAKLAIERVLKRLNPRKVKSRKLAVIYDPRVSASLVSHLASAVSGGAIARGTSLLKDKMGAAVCASNITIIDDPYLPRGLRSTTFDGEGLMPHKREIVKNGVLDGWLLDLKSARQLKLSSTGNARRSAAGLPAPAPHNLYMQAGDISPERLIAETDTGFYVTELMGSSVNLLTGDYSRGASGFWIEGGEIAYPVSEVTIAGNLADMWKNMTPANDLRFEYGTDAPTLRVEGMTLAGN